MSKETGLFIYNVIGRQPAAGGGDPPTCTARAGDSA